MPVRHLRESLARGTVAKCGDEGIFEPDDGADPFRQEVAEVVGRRGPEIETAEHHFFVGGDTGVVEHRHDVSGDRLGRIVLGADRRARRPESPHVRNEDPPTGLL